MLAVLRSPAFIQPCGPVLRDRLPKGEGWLYEVKFDGYRIQVHKAGPAITLYTRNGADWTERFPHLAAALTSLPCKSAIIDAELVHADGFEPLHRQVHERIEDDLMLWGIRPDGAERRRPARRPSQGPQATAWPSRRARPLRSLLHSETFEDGGRLLTECDGRGLEGVVAKHRASIYRSGRSTFWVKVKCPVWREANRNRGSCSAK